MYQPIKISANEFIPIRGHDYHVRVWGDPSKTYANKPLVLLHGWMDVGASFQFLVDSLKGERLILAPDWRGFGFTKNRLQSAESQDHFYFADYLGDLEFLIDHYFPDQTIDLLGHSMGGNICMLYAGIRAERIAKLINLEGFGMPSSRPSQAPTRYAKWLDELKKYHKGEITLQPYSSSEAVAQRLIKTNPRITIDKAQWLATQWAQPDAQGLWHIQGAAAHKISSANLYRVDEAREVHKRITAPVLCVTGEEDSLKKWFSEHYKLEEFYDRMKEVSNITHHQLAECGHMLHHDQPESLALVIESFLAQKDSIK